MAKTKEEFLQIRIASDEKTRIRKEAQKNGFDSISAYILWLCRNAGKSKK